MCTHNICFIGKYEKYKENVWLKTEKKLLIWSYGLVHIFTDMVRSFGLGYTLQPLYNMVHYNTVLDVTRFKDGSQKCIDYIEK